MVEWIEVKGPSVETAVEVAMGELGVSDRSEVEVEVLEEGEKGFLGIGRKDAVVRVKKKPARRRRRSRGRRGKGSADGSPEGDRGGKAARSGSRTKRKTEPSGKRTGGGAARSEDRPRQRPPAAASGGRRKGGRPGGDGGRRTTDGAERAQPAQRKGETVTDERTDEVDVEQQAEVVEGFLEGLLDAFGLEGELDVRVDEGIILADISGEQTEALIGEKAAIMYAIHELTRTVVQRKTMANARVRLDIGGYGERRREALGVYAGRLAEQVLEDGGEVMLEPMTAADRKVVHDAIAAIDGVRSYSEGEDPRRSVVIAPDGA